MHWLGRLLGTLTTVIALALAVAVAGFIVVAPRVIDGATLTVLSGSMSPTIPVGSVVLIRPVEDLLALEPGDVITYQNSPTERSLTTHRVARFQPDTEPPSYVTKGDANRGEDVDPVPIGAIRGEVVAHVPYLGQIGQLLGGARGPYLLAVAIGLLFIAGQVKRIVAAIRDDDDETDASADGGDREDSRGLPDQPDPTSDATDTVDRSRDRADPVRS